jgi:ribosome biogenesis ATPase
MLRQSSNALNKSTQGLWRRNKLNLNAAQEEQPSVPVETPQVPVEHPQKILLSRLPIPTKRKPRSTREDGPSKRTKLSAAKDYSPPSTRLSDLGGIDACIEKILELVAMPLCHPEIYLHTGVQPPRGVLLHGPPGCGKTMLANAIAGVSYFLHRCSLGGTNVEAVRNLVSLSSASPHPPSSRECLGNRRRLSVIPLMKQR